MPLFPSRSMEPTSGKSRREFLKQTGGGLGWMAAAWLMNQEGFVPQALGATPSAKPLSRNPLAPKPPHFAAKAKRVVYLFMHGGPSHVDLFDHKPELDRLAGKPLPDSFGEVMTRRKVANNPLLPAIRPIRPRGKSGLPVSDLLPEMATCADDLCVLRSVHGDSVNHPQSVYQMNTGSILMGKPSFGSWVSYGLGSENNNMPSFVVMPDPGGGIKGGPPAWGSGCLSASHQGTTMRPGKTPVLHLAPPPGMRNKDQVSILKFLHEQNSKHNQRRHLDDELNARIEAYELAYRMQTEAPELVNLADESEHVLKSYGIGEKKTDEFGTRCLLARRLLESGVRFVQLYSGNTNGWDAHNDVQENHVRMCGKTDKPVAALIKDLKQRGLWEDTLFIWGGEFGRMPMSESGKGRDHNPWGYSVVLGGGAVKGGMSYGATDPIGLRAVEDKVHVRDLHATLLHILGLDNEELIFSHNGLDEKLTGVSSANVVHDILT